MRSILFLAIILLIQFKLASQTIYLGADLSYVNEMEDCGEVYKENGIVRDPYQIFADHECNLVRLRLWHTPSWYDNLNAGNRYSDFEDVKKSIGRAKAEGMAVLLDFHLSDNWADPGKQRVPNAWLPVVNNLPVLKDSLYNYIYNTLDQLHQEGLTPEMVQIGNETNKGILLSPADDSKWTLDWPRNAQLFNSAISAVRAFETARNQSVLVALHLADPDEVNWLLSGFINNGVTDFDIIGMSYYWQWHKPTTIAQTGTIIKNLRNQHPTKQVMIFETAYIWTTSSADNANNTMNEAHPSYLPINPENQKKWLVNLTKEVVKNGGTGVIYWEPAWVSSTCLTQWGTGSHQENATFFDFQNNLQLNGGIGWLEENYLTSIFEPEINPNIQFSGNLGFVDIAINESISNVSQLEFRIVGGAGQTIESGKISSLPLHPNGYRWTASNLIPGWYAIIVSCPENWIASHKFVIP